MFFLQYFDAISQAYNYALELEQTKRLILIHSGTYVRKVLVFDNNLTLIGAGPISFFFLNYLSSHLS